MGLAGAPEDWRAGMRLLHYEPAVPNFGDDLNPLLWPELAPGLFGPDVSSPGTGAGESTAFVGIGTIIGIDPAGCSRLHVFSSGAGYSDPVRWQGLDVRYHCVRGPVSARALGLPADRALTDGAVLVPRSPLFADLASRPRTTRTVVVPHYETLAFPGWSAAAQLAGFDIVDPRGSPRDVIAALAGARLVLTESLHGAILADAFGVPWRGFAVSRNFSTAKWGDWAASLDMDVAVALVPPPDPMPLLRFGKRPEPFGTMIALDPEAALAEFRARIAAPPKVALVRRQAKRVLEAVPVTRRLLGFSPERTAQALVELATRDPFVSNPSRRAGLADEMLERLYRLAKKAGASAAVLA
ncbi:polysaccharide pyruvyl transferase family protein [Novosphingobium clariflavum]|uniref:Polysaccharide pyruvyl transferase family protein n=1 Tax=Novosphingobium clariflavum TaxID=2029884 RepID=A0ABV6S8A8_9SPHN|nr:polysaccharide pyruvyl transferase family protein [Novosphingobium clariflavum]